MNITAVENIPYTVQAFSQLGEVTVIPDKDLIPGSVDNTDILLVRSTMPVNEALLENSRVRFVGTATIGFDHVDLAYLSKRGITFASAPGSNANSVSEYITAVLLELATAFDFALKDFTLGIIGYGNVGSQVHRKALALGMNVLVNDPPLKDQTGDELFRPLEALFDADIITAHVPLIQEGLYPTLHLIDERFLSKMKPNSFLLNSSRGAVADTLALHRALDSKKLRGMVLDVWENEPNIDLSLREKVFIGTHHIAGHSFDGKVNGTRILFESVCSHLGVTSSWDPASLLPAPYCSRIEIGEDRGQNSLREIVQQVYNPWRDHQDLAKMKELPEQDRGPCFKRLRRDYPMRREFQHTRVIVPSPSAGLKASLEGLGFQI